MAAKSYLLGNTPASEFLSALTSIMNRIVPSPRGVGFGAALLTVRRTTGGEIDRTSMLAREASCEKLSNPARAID
jgi:hypothetical protein